MALPHWPNKLAEYFDAGSFSYKQQPATLFTDEKDSLSENREIVSDSPWTVSGTFICPASDLRVFTHFFIDTLMNGNLRFTKEDPIDKNLAFTWQFTKPFSLRPFGGDHYHVSIEIERVPGTKRNFASPTISLPSQVVQGKNMELIIAATVTGADEIIWKHNGIIMAGKSGDELHIPYASHGATGDNYSAVAKNAYGDVESNITVLTVQT